MVAGRGALTKSKLVQMRLSNQLLAGKKARRPTEVLRRLGALQAQDYGVAKWGLALRLERATNGAIERAYDEGQILRTHILRPTWHLVLPADIRWLLALTAPRVKMRLAPYDRRLGITPSLLARCTALATDALKGGKSLTRSELAGLFRIGGTSARVQRLAHIIIHLELDGLLCSGPRRGKQFTYALLDERVAKAASMSREESLNALACRYFTSHGPAQLQDFSWWSGLTAGEARQAVELAGVRLAHETLDGKTYWFSAAGHSVVPAPPAAMLLSIFDEYIIAYKDRDVLGEKRLLDSLFTIGNALPSILVAGGCFAGTWKRSLNHEKIEIRVTPLRRLSRSEKEAVEAAAADYGRFHELPVNLHFHQENDPKGALP